MLTGTDTPSFEGKAFEDPLQVGERLGDFHILGVLGRGGMSVVYEAEDTALKRRVAIKVVPDARVGAMLLRQEAQALAAIRHPAVPVVYGLGEHRGRPYLVLERLHGVVLEHQLARRQGAGLPIDEVIPLLLAIAEALIAVHRAGIAHRDLKPGNIMLCPGGRVVLLDFGIMQPEVVADSHRSGTPRYLAPEVIEGKVEPGSAHLIDTYAFGVLAFELLTGHAPFDSGGLVSLLVHHLASPPPDLGGVCLDAPASLVELVRSCLAKEPRDRPPMMDAVAWELRGLTAQRRTRVSPAERRHGSGPVMPRTVLLVEDDFDLRDELADTLRSSGYHVLTAAHGAEAMSLLEHDPLRPSVILLDWMMPVMDGMAFMAFRASQPRYQSIPVVVLSAIARSITVPAGRVSVLAKPCERKTLLATVERACAS